MIDEFLRELEKVLNKRLALYRILPAGIENGVVLPEAAVTFAFRVQGDLNSFILGYCYCFKEFIAYEADLGELIAKSAHLMVDLVDKRYNDLKKEY